MNGDQIHVLMFSTEYVLQRVGGLGAHVGGLAPYLGDRVSLDLIVPRFGEDGLAVEPLGRYGRLYRVDASQPAAGSDYDLQVWNMNDTLNEFVSQKLDLAQYDMIHTHDWLSSYIANDLHRRLRIPLIATVHATEAGRLDGHVNTGGLSERIHLAEWHLVQETDSIVACSEFMRREICNYLNASPEHISVIPNGIDMQVYDRWYLDRKEHEQALAQVQGDDDVLIFFVGRLVWQKGPDLLVDAMPKVLKRFPKARLAIAGRGDYRSFLVTRIEHLGLQDHVELLGFISDTQRNQLYASADVVAFPSRYEPFGIVALEAMSVGAPVIVSNVGGLCEVVDAGVTGLVVSPGDPDALADAILNVLLDPSTATRRAHTAREEVASRYTWQSIADLTAAHYEKVLLRDGE